MAWQPEKQRLLQITQLLKNVQSRVTITQLTSLQMLTKLNLMSDFNNYLIFILAKLTSEDESIRSISGYILKTNIITYYKTLRPIVIEFVKSECLTAVGDTSPVIRAIVGFLISKIASHGINTWPELLPALYQMLDSTDCNVCGVALEVLKNIFEDSSECLENDRKNKPLDILIPKCLQFFKHSCLQIKLSANECIDQLISQGSLSLINHSDVFLENFFHLPVDDATGVRQTVCKAIILILEVRRDRLLPHLHKIIEFMLLRTQDPVENIALEGFMFWELMADQKICIHVLAPYLTRLIPILISGMRYSKIEIISLQEEDENFPNNLEVTNLFGLNNIRTFSAAALGNLANVFKEDILPIIFPILKETFSSTEWVVKEYGILVIGIISRGCMNGMIPHLYEFIPYMIYNSNYNNPLIQATICWTLSCYCHWIVNQRYPEYYKPMIFELLNQMLNSNNRVQEAACSAFASLAEAATTDLLPYLEIILKTLEWVHYKYQHKNVYILYNTIGTFALSVGHNLNKLEYINILMPPLIEKLNVLNNEDEDLVPVLQCLSKVTAALQSGCMPFADQLFKRCISLVEQTLNQIRGNYLGLDYLYAELKILAALNQLSVLTNELTTLIESLISGSNILNLLYLCMQNPSNEVRQCSFVVLGNLAKSCFQHVYPFIADFMPILAQNLNTDLVGCNSATWAIGEIAVKLGIEMQQYVPIIVNELVITMNLTDTSRDLLQTAANTIGQLCQVCPNDIGPLIHQILRMWFYTLDNTQEMKCNDSAFMSMCQTISLNHCKVVQDFKFFCDAVASGNIVSKDEDMFYKVLHDIKNQLGEESWTAFTHQFPQQLKVSISTAYGI